MGIGIAEGGAMEKLFFPEFVLYGFVGCSYDRGVSSFFSCGFLG